MKRALFLVGLLLLGCEDDPQRPNPGPLPEGFIDPVWEYGRDLGVSITGGYVFRGPTFASLEGKYVYGDFGSGRIWALDYDGNTAQNELLLDTALRISTFGLRSDGTLLIADWGSGRQIYRLSGTYDLPSGTWDWMIAPAYAGPFDNVVDIRSVGDQLFVVEQAGRIQVVDTGGKPGVGTFLDISAQVASGGELGLLGLALHPDYDSNGWFFVYYTTTAPAGASYAHEAHLARFTASAGGGAADPGSELRLLTIPQHYANHNGGGIAFDRNGYLLLAVGDEGSGGDPRQNAQDLTDLHGKILRLDVDVVAAPGYAIPPDNPFAGNGEGFAEEIFAYGLRNPWRLSVDDDTGRIWVADVGQNSYEEVDVIVAGGNYGWDCREGAHPYVGPPDGPSPACAEVVEAP